jgi:hypothetical protein
MATPTLCSRQLISVIKTLLQIAQVSSITDYLPFIQENVGLAQNLPGAVTGDQKVVENPIALRIDNLHRFPTVNSIHSRFVGDGDWDLL